jgi:hypothetical protein
MITQNTIASLKGFLATLVGSKEVGLVIAEDQKELRNFFQSLDDAGFNKSIGIANAFESQKSYIIIDEDMGKNVYDFAVQYPTGQVEIFDNKDMRSKIFSPDYRSSIVLLVTQDVLNNLQTKGFNLLSAVGPAYRS